MKHKNYIIDQIESSVNENSGIFTSMGVCNGLAGASLFHYFRYMQNEDPKHHDLLFSYLEKSIEGLNDDYQGSTLIQDIIEIGVLIKLYQNRGLVDNDVFEMYTEHFNPILETILNDKIDDKNISPVTGALLIAKYFLKIGDDYSKIKPVIEIISNTAIIDKQSQGIYWVSSIERENKNYVEFGITHGVSGITNFLLNIASNYELNDEERKKIDHLITKSVTFIVHHLDDSKEMGFFPFAVNYSDSNDETLNLAYGDLGVLHVIWKSSVYLKNSELTKKIELNLKKIAELKNIENIRDANILYGTSGFSSFFQVLYPHLAETRFQEFWNEKTFSYANNDTEWAGFDSHFNKFDINTQLSFTNGIIGIGISLLHEQLDKEKDIINYLNFINY